MGVLMHSLGKIVGGQLACIGGLFLYIEGIKHGLMPLGDKIGADLPPKVSPLVLYIITFFTGLIGLNPSLSLKFYSLFC